MGVDEDIKIIMTAEDKASAEVQAAAKRINDEYRKMENVNRSVGRSMMLNNRELFATARVMTSIGNIAGRLTDIYTKYNIMQIRIGDTARRVTEAQDDLRRALLESGPGSQEAIDAARQLADAQDEAKRAADESKFAMVGFGLETLTAAGSIIQALPRFGALILALRGLAGASTLAAAAAAGGTVIPGMAGAGAAASGAATAGAEAFGSGPGGATVAWNAIQALIREWSDKIFGSGGIQVAEASSGDPPSLASRFNGAPRLAGTGTSPGSMGGFPADIFGQFHPSVQRDLLGGSITITVNGSNAEATAAEVIRQLKMAQVAH